MAPSLHLSNWVLTQVKSKVTHLSIMLNALTLGLHHTVGCDWIQQQIVE